MFRILTWDENILVAVASTYSEALRVCNYFQRSTKVPHYVSEVLSVSA
jgi:hypothetical protein